MDTASTGESSALAQALSPGRRDCSQGRLMSCQSGERGRIRGLVEVNFWADLGSVEQFVLQ